MLSSVLLSCNMKDKDYSKEPKYIVISKTYYSGSVDDSTDIWEYDYINNNGDKVLFRDKDIYKVGDNLIYKYKPTVIYYGHQIIDTCLNCN